MNMIDRLGIQIDCSRQKNLPPLMAIISVILIFSFTYIIVQCLEYFQMRIYNTEIGVFFGSDTMMYLFTGALVSLFLMWMTPKKISELGNSGMVVDKGKLHKLGFVLTLVTLPIASIGLSFTFNNYVIVTGPGIIKSGGLFGKDRIYSWKEVNIKKYETSGTVVSGIRDTFEVIEFSDGNSFNTTFVTGGERLARMVKEKLVAAKLSSNVDAGTPGEGNMTVKYLISSIAGVLSALIFFKILSFIVDFRPQ